uniref:Uncharacterized protein n=1 Tax=Arundo donax TaxID=35708 RepID=A0A0A9TRZ5_ARUDO
MRNSIQATSRSIPEGRASIQAGKLDPSTNSSIPMMRSSIYATSRSIERGGC